MTQLIPELLAPAGDFTCLAAALQGGADAIYFGVGAFNMRAGGATNFAVGDLPEIRRRTTAAGARAYLALNVIVFDRESAEISELLESARDQVDAVICWDPAVIEACRAREIPFHISTQASIANSAAAAFYRELGARRAVLARECTLEEIAAIRSTSGLPVEVFAHGAMCVSVSGRCFMSQDLFGRSGNRGECLQNCRRRYRVIEEEEGSEYEIGADYILSAQDLSTLPFLERLLATGIDALKIEGRGRNAEYVRTVTACYREAIDAWAAGTLDAALKDRLSLRLGTVFNRGFSSGFYLGRPVTDFTKSGGSLATTRKVQVGRVENYYRQAGMVAILVQDHLFHRGDRLLIQGPTTGTIELLVSEIRAEEEPLETARRGLITLPCPERVRVGDRAFLLSPNKP